MSTRKLITISLPPELLRKAERVAREEYRTKSELLGEALRFYVATKDIRRTAVRARVFEVLDQVQGRTQGVSRAELRGVIRDSIEAVRRPARRASA